MLGASRKSQVGELDLRQICKVYMLSFQKSLNFSFLELPLGFCMGYSIYYDHAIFRKIVVSTRAVAIKISEYFKEHNIGRMQCIIVDEIKAPSYRDKSSLTKKLTPLINGIQTSESLLPMFKAFTASWHLATTKNIALVTMKKQRQQSRHYQYNIVTAAGERFFGSGEIRSALAPRVFMRSLRESILKVACEKSRKTRVSQPAVTRSSLKALEHEKKTHEKQLKQQRQNVKKLIIAVEEVHIIHTQCPVVMTYFFASFGQTICV